MQVMSKDGPRDSNLQPLYGKLADCYRASPHRQAQEGVRVSLRVAVSPTGAVTMTATPKLGTLVDKGGGAHRYEYEAELPKSDDTLSKCIDAATKSATVTVPEASRGTSFDVTIDFSP
jgi:hypothetical protein